MEIFRGRIVDVTAGRIFPGRFSVENGRIAGLAEDGSAPEGRCYLPGLVDAHIHIESSLLPPAEFARAAVVHGTVATVSDPHEIANVCGIAGVEWMIASGNLTPLKINFGAPSCVPATPFETAGAAFGPEEVSRLLDTPGIGYLSEVMNFPAVLSGDPRMAAIIDRAKQKGVPIDGHAPGVVGEDLRAYARAGIRTDHECVTLDEARQRVACGMKVAIREGSAARNFDELWPLLRERPDECFFCSDDRHPDDLVVSHVDGMIRRAIANGIDPMAAIRAASLNPVRHYGLPAGLLREGDPADFVEVASLDDFRVRATWIDGRAVAREGRTLLERSHLEPINLFDAPPVAAEDLRLEARGDATFAVIVAKDGQLVTGREDVGPTVRDGTVVPDPSRDLLKIAVVNRYRKAPPQIGLIRNFGLRTGAIAGSVAHDSHNVVAVGADDASLREAINAVIAAGGGLAFHSPSAREIYPLPIAGLMGTGDAWEAAAAFEKLTRLAKEDGCPLRSPYMTLSFMCLLVIPSLKIGDRGHFDVGAFALVDPWGRPES
ncbi:MAG: adenine deaminase [Puniceicoccaceae bacterium]